GDQATLGVPDQVHGGRVGGGPHAVHEGRQLGGAGGHRADGLDDRVRGGAERGGGHAVAGVGQGGAEERPVVGHVRERPVDQHHRSGVGAGRGARHVHAGRRRGRVGEGGEHTLDKGAADLVVRCGLGGGSEREGGGDQTGRRQQGGAT